MRARTPQDGAVPPPRRHRRVRHPGRHQEHRDLRSQVRGVEGSSPCRNPAPSSPATCATANAAPSTRRTATGWRTSSARSAWSSTPSCSGPPATSTPPSSSSAPRATSCGTRTSPRLSPLKHRNLNLLGRYSFTVGVPAVGVLRPLRDPDATELDEGRDRREMNPARRCLWRDRLARSVRGGRRRRPRCAGRSSSAGPRTPAWRRRRRSPRVRRRGRARSARPDPGAHRRHPAWHRR